MYLTHNSPGLCILDTMVVFVYSVSQYINATSEVSCHQFYYPYFFTTFMFMPQRYKNERTNETIYAANTLWVVLTQQNQIILFSDKC